MDLNLILAIAAAFGLGLMLALLVLGRRKPAESGEAARAEIQAVSGRLAQMAESQAAVQARLAAQMQAQERALSKAVEERLAGETAVAR